MKNVIYEDCLERKFIVNYVINEDSITVYYENNESDVFPYSKEKEKELLQTMREQVKNMLSNDNSLKLRMNLNVATSVLDIISSTLLFSTDNGRFIVPGILFATAAACQGIVFASNYLNYRELQKYELYYLNEKELDDKISYNDLDDYTYKELKSEIDSSNEMKLEQKKA